MRGASARLKPAEGVTPEAMAAVVPLAAASARLMMLVPATLELLPMTPTVPSPLLPRAVCHWMPKSASLLALTSTIRLSTSTWARRPSSLSMTARSCRYCGSLAVMMSELVAGSAWMVPPVEGWALLPKFDEAPLPRLELLLPSVEPKPEDCGRALVWVVCGGVPVLPGMPVVPVAPGRPVPMDSEASAARSVTASRVASAFFR